MGRSGIIPPMTIGRLNCDSGSLPIRLRLTMAWVGVFTASITYLYLNQLAFYFIISGNLDKDFLGSILIEASWR